MTERELCYNDRYIINLDQEIDQDTAGDSINNERTLSDEKEPVILWLTQSEYDQIFDSVQSGADLLYPDNAQEITWLVWKGGKVSGDACQFIIDCLENPESGVADGFHDWLIDQLMNDKEVRSVTEGFGGDQTTPMDTYYDYMAEECDLDILFGFCRQLVQMMNTCVSDFYEILEAKTNLTEAVNLVASDVNPITISVAYIEFMQNSIVEAYKSNYTLELENQYACDLFCLALQNENCTLSWQDVTEYFADQLATSTENQSLLDILVFLLAGSWSGSDWCDLSMLVFAFIMKIGAAWTGTTLPIIQVIVQSFFNDPDSDWQTLCACKWEETYDWNRDNQDGWNDVRGQWATWAGFYSTSTGSLGITVDRTFSPGFDGLLKVEVDTDRGGAGSPQVYLTVTHGSGQVQDSTPVVTNGWTSFEFQQALDNVTYIEMRTETQAGLSVAYQKFRLSGAGDNPPPETTIT